MDQGVRGLDSVGLDNLGNQLLPQLSIGLTGRLRSLGDERPRRGLVRL